MGKLFESSSPRRFILPTLFVLTGGIILALSAASLSKDSSYGEGMVKSMTILAGETATAPFASAWSGILLSLIGGAATAGSGVLGVLLQAVHFRRAFMVIIICGVITGAVLTIAGAAMVSSLPALMSVEDHVVQNLFKSSQKLEGTPLAWHAWGLAAFDACCGAETQDIEFISQSQIQPCNGPETCPTFLDSRVNDIQGLPLDKLCTCIPDVDAHNRTVKFMKDSGYCKVLENTKAKVDPRLQIPTVPIEINAVLQRFYPGTKLDLVPIVGKRDIPVFGCGIGYYKGMHWYNEIYVSSSLSGFSTGCFVLGGINLIILAGGLAMAYSYAQNDHDESENNALLYSNNDSPVKAGGMENGIAMASIVAGNQQPQQQVAVFVNSSSSSSSISEEQIASKLRDFYAKYDSSKTETDIANVSAWTVKPINGLDALNQKLRDKYQADLTNF